MKKFFAFVLFLFLLAAPAFPQSPRYQVTPAPITDVAHESAMFKEFAGEYSFGAFSTVSNPLGFHGALAVTDKGVSLTFTNQYLGPQKGVVTLTQEQVFTLDGIIVADDTIKDGAIFTAKFHYTIPDEEHTVVSLVTRVFPNGRFVGAIQVGEAGHGSAYLVFAKPTNVEKFVPFLNEVTAVFLASALEDDPLLVVMAWGRGELDEQPTVKPAVLRQMPSRA